MNIFLLNVYYLILNSNIPYFLKCKTCKYVKNVSFNKYVCKKFINIDFVFLTIELTNLLFSISQVNILSNLLDLNLLYKFFLESFKIKTTLSLYSFKLL